MNIEGILDELESLLLDAFHITFTNKRVVEEDDIVRLLDDLRENLPGELAIARQIISEKQRMLDQAQEEAHKIVAQAKAQAIKLTEENVIIRQAQEQSSEMIALARKEADHLCNDAVVYADSVFKHLEGQISRTLEVVHSGHSELSHSKKKIT